MILIAHCFCTTQKPINGVETMSDKPFVIASVAIILLVSITQFHAADIASALLWLNRVGF